MGQMIAKKSFLMIVTNLASAIIGWLGIIIIARLWGSFAPTALGIIAFGMAFIGMFSLITDLGYRSAHIKRISEGKKVDKCIGTYLVIKLILCGVLAFIVLGSIFIWKYVLHKQFYDSTKESVVYIFLLYYILYNIVQIPIFTFRAKQEIAKTEIPLLIGTIVRVGGMILVALAGVTGISLIDKEFGKDVISPKYTWPNYLEPLQTYLSNHAIGSLASAYAISMFITLVIMFYFLKNYKIGKPTKKYFKSYTSFAIPSLISQSMYLLAINTDKVIIGFFWSAQEVGYYFGAQRITFFMRTVPLAVGTLIFPAFSSLHSKNKTKDIKTLLELSVRYMSMLIIPIVVFILVFSKPIINIILSSDFYPAYIVLCLLAIFMWVSVLSTPYGYLIGGMNKPWLAAKISITTYCINIVLNFLFIPKNGLLSFAGINGIEGAAIATLIAAFFRFFAARIVVKKLLGIKMFQKAIFIHLFSALIMGSLLYSINIFIALTRWYHLIIFSLFGLGIYLAILNLLKEFTKKEYKLVIDILNIKEMKNYIKSELKRKK